MMLLPVANNQESFILLFIVLGLVLVAMSFYRSPAGVLMPDLTSKELRSKAKAVINLMGATGGIFTLVAISMLIRESAEPDYTYVFLAVAILMVVTVAILFITIQENQLLAKIKQQKTAEQPKEEQVADSLVEQAMTKDVKRSLFFILASTFLWFTAYNAIITDFSCYAVRVWGLEGGRFANILGFIIHFQWLRKYLCQFFLVFSLRAFHTRRYSCMHLFLDTITIDNDVCKAR